MMWIGISLAISIAISMVVPFPLNIFGIIAVFIGLNYFIRQRQMRKMGMMGQGSFFGMRGGSMFGGGGKTVNYYCMNYGMKHDERACPRCGSTATRIG
jgi:hypothetical protein